MNKNLLFAVGLGLTVGTLLHGVEVKYTGNVPAFKYAAAELQKYEKAMLEGKTSKAVFNFSIDPKMQEEEWKIRSTANGVALSGGSARGFVYALYHYLEDVCGVIFLNYNADYIPKLADLPTKNLKLNGKPAFKYRTLSPVDFGRGEFSAKRRINMSGWSRIAPEYGGDASPGRPAPCHSFAAYYPFSGANKKNHPEYFSLVNGKRIGGQFQGQLCLSNPGLREEMLKKLYLYMDLDQKDFESGKRHSIPDYYDISQNDNQNYCRCDKCKALAKKYGNKQSGIMLDFINQMAEGAAKKRPGTNISTFAYQYTEDLPVNIKANENVIAILCDTMGNCAAPLTDSSNARSRRKIERWGKIAKLGFWDYGDQFSRPKNLPVASEFTYADNAKYLLKNNIIDNRLEISSRFYPDSRELKFYLMSNLHENPDADFNKLREKFAKAYYGPAAELFLQYRNLIYESGKKKNIFICMYPDGAGFYPHFDIATIIKAHELFEQGRGLLKGNAELLKRWDLAALALDRATLWRALHLQNEWFRMGKNPVDFPVKNLKAIYERAKKTQFEYTNELNARLKPTPHNLNSIKRTNADLNTEYKMLDSIIQTFSKNIAIPDEFKNIAPERLYVYLPEQFALKNKKFVEDKDALSGKAIEFFKQNAKKTAVLKMPFRVEHFDYFPWKGTTGGWVYDAQLPANEFVWVRFGNLKNVSTGSTFALHGWALLCPIADATAQFNNNFEGWIRMKAERGEDKKITRLLIDSIVLVRDVKLEKAADNTSAVKVNDTASFAVSKNAAGSWNFEYKRIFNNKNNAADWIAEFGKTAINNWRIHPKYKYIQGLNRNIVLKFDLPDKAENATFSARISNYHDSKTRTVLLQISEDGKNYKTVKEEKFFPNSGFITFNYNVNGRKTVWVRFIRKIDKGDNAAYAFGALFKEVCVRINGRI